LTGDGITTATIQSAQRRAARCLQQHYDGKRACFVDLMR
jgi:hypothetical protein